MGATRSRHPGADGRDGAVGVSERGGGQGPHGVGRGHRIAREGIDARDLRRRRDARRVGGPAHGRGLRSIGEPAARSDLVRHRGPEADRRGRGHRGGNRRRRNRDLPGGGRIGGRRHHGWRASRVRRHRPRREDPAGEHDVRYGRDDRSRRYRSEDDQPVGTRERRTHPRDGHHGGRDRPGRWWPHRQPLRLAATTAPPPVRVLLDPAQDRRRGCDLVSWHMSGVPARGLYAAVQGALEQSPDADDDDGVWARLTTLVDPAESRPQLAPDVEVKEFHLRWGNDYAMVANPRELLHYQLEPGEIELLPLMDGTRTVKEIVVERFRESGDMELSAVADLVQTLRVGNFLTTPYVDVPAAVKRAGDTADAARVRAREFAKTLMLSWNGAHGLVEWFYRYLLRWVFIPWIGALVLLAAVGGFAAFWSSYQAGTFSLSTQSPAVESLVLLAMSYFLTSMHELGHAVVLVHYGRRVKSAGFMIYFGSPAFFVDSSDGLMMDRGKRIVQSFGGPYAELVIAGASAALAWAFPDWSLAPAFYKFALLNYF